VLLRRKRWDRFGPKKRESVWDDPLSAFASADNALALGGIDAPGSGAMNSVLEGRMFKPVIFRLPKGHAETNSPRTHRVIESAAPP
jgi:hypothetical protein